MAIVTIKVDIVLYIWTKDRSAGGNTSTVSQMFPTTSHVGPTHLFLLQVDLNFAHMFTYFFDFLLQKLYVEVLTVTSYTFSALG